MNEKTSGYETSISTSSAIDMWVPGCQNDTAGVFKAWMNKPSGSETSRSYTYHNDNGLLDGVWIKSSTIDMLVPGCQNYTAGIFKAWMNKTSGCEISRSTSSTIAMLVPGCQNDTAGVFKA